MHDQTHKAVMDYPRRDAGNTLRLRGAPSIDPLGTKGAGGMPILNVGATTACAVADAMGKQVSKLPLTPPRVPDILDPESAAPMLPHLAG